MHTKKRIAWIDISKAIGIFIVLINHAMLNLGIITFLGGMFYMPVFFVLSGYTFKENYAESFKSFLSAKAKRLLLPYMFFQLFLTGMYTIKNLIEKQSFFQAIMPVLGAVYSRNALYPSEKDVLVKVPETNINLMSSLNAPLWFLTALFVSLIVYKFILLRADNNKKKELIYVSISIVVGIGFKYLCPFLLPWSIDTALISVGFLHMGRILEREHLFERLCKKPLSIALIIFIFVVTSYINGSVNMSVRDFGKSVVLYLIVGSLGTISIMFLAVLIEKKLTYIATSLELIGRHTIGILALHLGIYAIVESLFTMIGWNGITVEKVVEVLLAVVILVPVDIVILKYLPFVYGLKRRN